LDKPPFYKGFYNLGDIVKVGHPTNLDDKPPTLMIIPNLDDITKVGQTPIL
jgi:hypothetical protein